ncbi:YbdK family carboxylate-amine ligase [Kitasatospora xanthocidica]|uniref:Putative glutamate--cysteine ligase 2 n=1 Tax=Kitasatospora xanthocidica TaxID=83382 RepID=A0A372ZN04_9ACTN|nr:MULTISPECIES: YbdK family carboxylate-amine ligase [Kitasatospora]RGD56862.1 YbdK family carboxylate-amine ligase [Kitasatospora xanthocidica]
MAGTAGRGRGPTPTVGVEEEHFLVDPVSRAVVPAGPRLAARAAGVLGDLVSGEFTDLQVEVRTPPCATMRELSAQLARLRRELAACAEAEGLAVCPSATPVIGGGGVVPVGHHPRYLDGVELFRGLMDDFAVCALHVHVCLPDREVAALVGNHLRPWLPLLVEMSANSPFHAGRDTRYASWRSVLRLRFPSLGPPPWVESFDDYRRVAAAMAEVGGSSFADLPFWDTRPHPRLPTLEVRCMDVPAESADSVALAAVVRGLVVTSARLAERGDKGPQLRGELLRGSYWYATRDGWPGPGADGLTGRVLPAPERARRLVEHIGPALEELGDLERVAAFVDRLAARGSGAHRQRAAHRAGGLSAVVDDLATCMTTLQAVPPRPSVRRTPQGRAPDGCASVEEAGRPCGPMSTDARERPEKPMDDSPEQHGRPPEHGGRVRRDGYARLSAADLGIDTVALAEDFTRLADSYQDLPPDPYARETHRFRRYSHAVHLPWTGELSYIPGTPDEEFGTVTEYWQDEHNPEYPRVRRRLPDIPEALHRNRLLDALVHADLDRALWLEDLRRVPVYVGIHLISLGVHDQDQEAVSSPNCLHQDGGSPATFTFAHLIGRRNVKGGENVIATPESAGRQPDALPPEAIHDRFVLTEPLDGYGVHDRRVSHYVGPVRLGDDGNEGRRDILIIGIAPYAPGL